MKKIIAMLLAVMLCIAVFPLSTLAADWPQDNYITSIGILDHGSGPNGRNYVDGYYLVRTNLMPEGAGTLSGSSIVDLNWGAGGNYIYMGILKGNDYEDAIKGIIFVEKSDDSAPEDSIVYGGVTFLLVDGAYEDTPLSDKPVNLNEGAGGKYIYTYITRDNHYNGGKPFTNMAIARSNREGYTISVFATGDLAVAGNTDGAQQDLNAGTEEHEYFIYVIYKRGAHQHTYSKRVPFQSSVHTQTELKASVVAHYRCEVCGKYFDEDKKETTLEALSDPTPQHTYGNWKIIDETHHKGTCTVCGLETELLEHVYDDDSDTTCNDCYFMRQLCEHTYSEEWSYNEYKHWHDATCGHTAQVSEWASHVFTDLIPAQSEVHTATELKPSVAAHYQCTVCLAYFDEDKNPTTLEALTGTTPQHSYSDEWVSTDSTGHWKECACGLKSEEADHVYDNVLDADCNICGYVREITHVHTYAEEWSYNEYKHWHDATCEHTTLTSGWASHVFTDLIPAQSEVHTATECKPSVAAHYQCTVCLTYFDANKNPTTLEALTGTTPQHSYSDDQDTTCDICGYVRSLDENEQTSCTITFDPNGGTGTMDPQTVTSGTTQTLNGNQFTLDGYSFEEWNTAADGSGDAFDDGDAITASSDITLYAQWKKQRTVNTIKITKQLTDQSVTEGQSAQLSIEATGDELSYQWWVNRNDGQGWKRVDGASSNVYVIDTTELANNGYKYRCLVTDKNKNRVLSDGAVLYVSESQSETEPETKPETTPDSQSKNQSETQTVPGTGDSSAPMLWLAICLLSLTGILLRKKSYGK